MSTAPGTAVVADIADKLFSYKPCIVIVNYVATLLIQYGPITHSSTGPKPDSCHLPCDIRPDIMLMPDALDPFFFIIRYRHRMLAYPPETSHTFFCFSRCISLSLNS